MKSWDRLRSWWRFVVVAEGLIVLLSLAYTGPNQYDRRTGGEGNRLARLFIDDPSWLESFGLLLLISHLAIGALLFMAWASAPEVARDENLNCSSRNNEVERQ